MLTEYQIGPHPILSHIPSFLPARGHHGIVDGRLLSLKGYDLSLT